MSKPKTYHKVCETCMEAFTTKFNKDTECAACKNFDGRLIEIPVEKLCNRCDKKFTTIKTLCYTDINEPPIVTYGQITCPTCRKWLVEFQHVYGYSEEALEVEHDNIGHR